MKSLKTIFARAALPAMLAMVPALASAQSSPIPISACGVISPDPGGNKNYVLTQDLNAPGGGTCLQFQGVANATLDGQGHAIAAGFDSFDMSTPLILQNSPSATVKNVTLVGASPPSQLFVSQIQVINQPQCQHSEQRIQQGGSFPLPVEHGSFYRRQHLQQFRRL